MQESAVIIVPSPKKPLHRAGHFEIASYVIKYNYQVLLRQDQNV
jgi:hypothetical protein